MKYRTFCVGLEVKCTSDPLFFFLFCWDGLGFFFDSASEHEAFLIHITVNFAFSKQHCDVSLGSVYHS